MAKSTKAATKTTTKKAAPKAKAKTATPAKAKTFNKCTCGCGGQTQSRFMPGHDARLKGLLQKAYRNGGLSATQKTLVSQLNWDRFMKADSGAAMAAMTEKTGLNVPQVHILKALSRASDGLSRPEITEKTKVAMALTDHLGPVFTDEVAKVEERTGFRCLLGMKLVSVSMEDRGGRDTAVYSITAAGRKKVEALSK